VARPSPSSGLATSVTPKHSLWALAFGCLQRDKPELAKQFLLDLGIRATGGEGSNDLSPGLDNISHKAFQELRKISESQDELSRTNAAIRKTFEQTVKIISASKDAISLAVSANPYAALAWTGVSLLLPVSHRSAKYGSIVLTIAKLVLNPSQENEAAIKGLDRVTNIISVHKWLEKNYLQDPDATSDLEDRTYGEKRDIASILSSYYLLSKIQGGASEIQLGLAAGHPHGTRAREVKDNVHSPEGSQHQHPTV